MTFQDKLDKSKVPNERGISLGKTSLSPALIWVGVWVIVCATFINTSIYDNTGGLGIPIMVLATVVYSSVVWGKFFEGKRTTPLALGSRGFFHSFLMMRRNTHVSELPVKESFVSGRSKKKPPGIRRLGTIDIIPCEIREGIFLGVGADRSYATRTICMRVEGPSLLSQSTDAIKERQNGLAELLTLLAGRESLIEQLIWRDQTFCGELQDAGTIIDNVQSVVGLTRNDRPNLDQFKSNVERMSDTAVFHRTTFIAVVSLKKLERRMKSYGKDATENEVLADIANQFYLAVMGSGSDASPLGFTSGRLLSFNDMVIETRLSLDPVFLTPYWQRWGRKPPPIPSGRLLPVNNAWTQFADFQPRDYARAGMTYHMGYWVEEYPPRGLFPRDFWNVVRVPVPKIVTAVFPVIPQDRSIARATYASGGERGTIRDMVQFGQSATMSQQRRKEEAEALERDVVYDSGESRHRLHIDVTGASVEEARAHVKKLEESVLTGAAPFTLSPRTGKQSGTIDAAMPFGRGLASYRLPKLPV